MKQMLRSGAPNRELVMSKLRKTNVGVVLFWCPGCEEAHQVSVEVPGEVWGFNGDYEKPTFTPSYLTWVDPNPNADPKYENGKYFNGFRCHSFITDGKIQFLGDCTHKLAGQTVELPEFGL
jgi:hypothetical protein